MSKFILNNELLVTFIKSTNCKLSPYLELLTAGTDVMVNRGKALGACCALLVAPCDGEDWNPGSPLSSGEDQFIVGMLYKLFAAPTVAASTWLFEAKVAATAFRDISAAKRYENYH